MYNNSFYTMLLQNRTAIVRVVFLCYLFSHYLSIKLMRIKRGIESLFRYYFCIFRHIYVINLFIMFFFCSFYRRFHLILYLIKRRSCLIVVLSLWIIFSVSFFDGIVATASEDSCVTIWKKNGEKQTIELPSQTIWTCTILPNTDVVTGSRYYFLSLIF